MHGGEIRLGGDAADGARFEVRIPFDTGLAPKTRRVPLAAPSVEPFRARRRVLVVDDEALILKSFQRMLTKDFDVVTADDGSTALIELEKDARFAAIVCDLIMPKVDGSTFYEVVKHRFPDLTPRIVFCSGGAFTPRARAFVDSIPNTVLEKPVAREMLSRAIDQVASAPR
jgi:CheY-like chemotaxis protein